MPAALLLISLLFPGFSSSLCPGSALPPPAEAEVHGEKAYEYLEGPVSYLGLEEHCGEQGGRIATMKDEEEVGAFGAVRGESWPI